MTFPSNISIFMANLNLMCFFTTQSNLSKEVRFARKPFVIIPYINRNVDDA